MRVRNVLLLMLSCCGLLLGACNNGGAEEDTGTSSATPAGSAPSSPSSADSSTSAGSSAPLSPVPKVFDSAAMQSSVQQVLTESYGVEGVEGVTCPSGQQVVPDSTFDCSVVVAGETKHVTITVKSTDGKYEVGALS